MNNNLNLIPSLESLSKESLILLVKELQAKLSKRAINSTKDYHGRLKENSFNFISYKQRKIALHVSYIGHSFQGLALQEEPNVNTVETKLIQSIDSCHYSRCGRTDKGVSAFKQIMSLHIRSNEKNDPFISSQTQMATSSRENELPYISILNSVLPDDIRVLGWKDVPVTFNARFNCLSRTYHYYFLADDLDIEKMRQAASLYTGTHNFRNFCKIDKSKESIRFERTIVASKIEALSYSKDIIPSLQQYVFIVTGKGFLYHQVRCMMGMLFLVGRHLEDPSIISYMYSATEKPTYHMADEDALMLWDCEFEDLEFDAESYNDPKNAISKSYYKSLSKNSLESCFSRAFYDQYLRCKNISSNSSNDIPAQYRENLTKALNRSSYTPIGKRKRTDS